MQSSSSSEFRQRGHQRVSSNNSLPRPGANPRASPTQMGRRTYSGGAPPPPPKPAYQSQRSTSYTSPAASQHKTAYGAPSSSFNPSGSSTPFNGGYSGGYATAGSGNGYSNGYGNGYGSSSNLGSSSHRRSEDDKYAKKPKRKSSGSGGLPPMGIVIGVIILFVYAMIMTVAYMSTNGQRNSMLSRLDLPDTISVVNKVEDLKRKLDAAERTKRTAETSARSKFQGEINRLTREQRNAQAQVDEAINEKLPAAVKQLERHGVRDDAFMDQVKWLQDRTRRESKRMVLERFGPGPHKVEVTYAMADVNDSNAEKKRYKFLIELAPLELVPHAIHLFLEQVDHGLMEGTHFYLNGPHIVQAGPQPDWTEMDGSDDAYQSANLEAKHSSQISGSAVNTIEKFEKQAAKKKLEYDDDAYESYYTDEELYEEDKRTKKFQDLGLDQLAFPDYHENFPHTPWTIGYTGRPGGPDWYINKVDNTKGHGPGGQQQHALEEQGDSCFGIISIEGSGRDNLAATIYQTDIYADSSEWHYFISNPIEIVSASILTKNPILDRHLHLDHLHSQHKVYDYRRRENKNGQEGELPDARVTHGEGVVPGHLPQGVQDTIDSKNGRVTVNKVKHGGHRPHIHGAADA